MHGLLIVIGPDPDAQIERALRRKRLCDGAGLGWGAAKGCLELRRGAKGVRGSDLLAAAGDEVPSIILEHDRSLSPRVENGVDQARKRDIENLQDLVDLVRPAAVVMGGAWVLPDAKKKAVPMTASTEWFARVQQLLDEAPDDALISIYDMHL